MSIVPTDVPMTAALNDRTIRNLVTAYPFLRSEVLTFTAFGRPVRTLVIGSGPRKLIYTAAHHANEWITTPVLLKFAEDLARAGSEKGQIFGIDAGTLLKKVTIYMIPMVNPDGVDLVTGAIRPGQAQYVAGQLIADAYPAIAFPDGWKANLLGVDLNLNYPAGWDQARSIKFAQGYTRPSPRDYVGTGPLDQKESRALAGFTEFIGPDLILAFHSQGKEIYWKFLDYEIPGARALGERFAQVSGYALSDTPYASGFAGYKDWFIQNFRRPGYTIEVGSGTNPLPLSQFDTIYADNLGILAEAARGL